MMMVMMRMIIIIIEIIIIIIIINPVVLKYLVGVRQGIAVSPRECLDKNTRSCVTSSPLSFK